ncbi:MAG: formimidoylglutamate deiminase [Micromonosporaceae bacterium]
MSRYHADVAWLSAAAGLARGGVLIEIIDGRISAVTTGVGPAPPDAEHLPGLVVPGLANVHSHAFHRALRGRTQAGKGTFWTWRERMYALAGRLTPDSYQALARATFAEMALAGISCVGEFHYLHHDPQGRRYDDPNAMGHAVVAAAREAGVRLTLLDTLYLTSGVDAAPLTGPQLRFGDGDVDGWRARLEKMHIDGEVRLGAAVHSVRAVPAESLGAIGALGLDGPLHFHLSEQRAENAACLATHGCSPTELLHSSGLLGPRSVAVHATHLSDVDRALLGDTDTAVCLCPTTERDLADGIGPARALVDAGSPLSLGSDSNAVIDLFEEARAVELDERLRSERRGHFSTTELLHAATAAGHAALGWTDAGRIEPRARADLVAVRLDSVRGAGHDPADPAAAVVFAANAADVSDVIVDGRRVVADGRHLLVDDVASALHDAIGAVWS